MGTVEYSEVILGKVTVRDMWDLYSGAAGDSYRLEGCPVLLYLILIKHIFPVRKFTEFA